MQYVNAQMIADAINELDTPFDAHEVERRVLRKQPIAFANELLRYAQSNDVLRAFSAQFAKYVDSAMNGQIRQTTKVTSPNLGGLESECQQWEKLVSPCSASVAVPLSGQ